MKVKISMVVDIDPEAWTLNYGVEGISQIRDDVRNYVEQGMREHLREMGVLQS